MKIIGELRPVSNKVYIYKIANDKGQSVKASSWEVQYNGRVLTTNLYGQFRFDISLAGKNLKLVAKVIQNGKTIPYFVFIVVLQGTPKILPLKWQDQDNRDIGTKTVGYLDKVQLVIKTINIPVGDTLSVTIYEDEYADGHGDSSRNMGTYTTKSVDKYGNAYLYFNNIQLYQKKLNNMDFRDEDTHEYYAQVVYRSHIDEIKDGIQLKVKNELTQFIKPPVTNNPVVVGKVESTAKTQKKAVDFTFGVFLDGTLNNMYNTEVRQLAEGKKVENTSGLGLNKDSAKKVYGKVNADDMEGSYQNDLSNPAILFKNYLPNLNKKIFRIYTEGVGSNTAPKTQGAILTAEDYKKDDVMQGTAFGMGNAGIMNNVRKAIRDVKEALLTNVKDNEKIGTITFDVFGFSRGAAAARHFVHVVNYPTYPAKTRSYKEGFFVEDHFGYDLEAQYANKMMPSFGYLGQLLDEAKLLTPELKIKIRFVGIYDTVPHHGLFQWNDIKDLGLDDVNKADYVVHMTAADEHRANFSLVDISSVAKTSPNSGKKGGIELAFPGVHCDVGGSYEEGRGDNPLRIDATIFSSSLEPLREELIRQGWFYGDEIFIKLDLFGTATITKNIHRLEGKRAKLSNQYSFIPLHIMSEFCGKKQVPINNEKLLKFKRFYENSSINGITGNVKFLEGVKDNLKKYSFEGGKPITFQEPQIFVEPPIVYEKNSINASIYIAERNQRQIDGDARMLAEANKKNETLKFLRNHYLHWNSTYGESGMDIAVQKNYPNKEHGKRKRHVR